MDQDCLLGCLGTGGTVCGHGDQDDCMANIYLYEDVAGYDEQMDVCRLAICFDMVGMEERYPGNVNSGLRMLVCPCTVVSGCGVSHVPDVCLVDTAWKMEVRCQVRC
jgi:hypothetical protein